MGLQPESAYPLLTLEEALREAAERNPAVLQARNRSAIASNERSLGNAGLLPNLNLSMQQNRRTFGSGMGEVGFWEGGTLDVSTNLGYTLFDGLRRPTLYRLLGVEEEIAHLSEAQVVEAVLADVAVVYYDLVRQQQVIATLREAIEISEDRLRIAEFQLEVGSASELEVRRAQVDRNADRSALVRQQIALAEGRATLARLLAEEGVSPDFRVADSIPVLRELDVEALFREALDGNRGIRMAREGMAAAELDERLVAGERFPVVGVTMGYAFNNLADPLGLTPSRPSGITYGASLSLPLFDGLNRRRRAENARIRATMSRITYEEARTRVVTEMETALESFRARVALVELEEENAALAARNVEVALERFRQGLSTSLELREVQNALTNARSRLAGARFDTKRAEVELLRLAGKRPTG